MQSNYWQNLTAKRANRRKVLAAGAVASASALFLAACGGSDDKSSGGSQNGASSLLTQVKDETKAAKSGGVGRVEIRNDILGVLGLQ